MSNKVYFFATCLASVAMGQTAANAIRLLQNAGARVIFKNAQSCCGQPSYNSGYFEESKSIALNNAELFSQPIPVIVPSGSCAGMMSKDYLELFKDDESYPKIADFSSRVIELSEYLEQLDFLPEDKGEKVKITWHSNCHALRVQKSIDANKRLLRALKNVEISWLENEEECCGFGGTFAVKEPQISDAMAKAKINDIINSGAKYIISADAGCLLNIKGTLARLKSDVKAVHLYDFLWARMNGSAL